MRWLLISPKRSALLHDQGWRDSRLIMERRILIFCNSWLTFADVLDRILFPVVMFIIILINRLRLEASNRIEFFDFSCPQTRQGTENRSLDFSNLSILDRINKCVLSAR